MTVSNLSKLPVTEVIDCFLAAFSDYSIKMPPSHAYYKERWKAAGVDFNLSYGMFDGEKLVGFIIHAVDRRDGKLTAYNTGTGVIPDYRGKRIVKSIYAYALKDLQKKGIERTTLEVITTNDKAIRAYKGVGFKINRNYSCFAGDISTESNKHIEAKQVPFEHVNWEQLPNQQYYSWDFQKETILAGKNVFYEVLNDDTPESYFILNPDKHYLVQFDLLNTNNKGWERLFSAIKQVSANIKVINVDERLVDKLAILNVVDLAISVKQFEMELDLETSHK
jgi:GNAT superfamily N-acetyltransferase